MSKVITVIIVIVLMVGLTTAIIWDMVANNKTLEPHQAIKFIVGLAGGVLTIIRLCKNERSVRIPLSVYEKRYEKYIKDAFSNDKKSRKTLLEAYRLYDEERYKDALRLAVSLKKTADRIRDREAVAFLCAVSQRRMGMLNDAIKSYNVVISINPANVYALSNLGTVYLDMGKYDEATLCFDEALRYEPDFHMAIYNRAFVFFKMGDYDRALELAHKAFELKPDMGDAASLLSICYAAKGNLQLSDKYYKIAVSNGEDGKALKNVIAQMGDIASVSLILEKWKKLTNRESVYIRLGAKTGKSVVGGRLNENPPLDRTGKPMRLLSAIFMSEMPHLEDFPRQGVLRFYIAENDTYGADLQNPTAQRDFRVLYDDDESRFISGAYNKESEYFPVYGSYRISFNKSTEAMPLDTMGAYELMEQRLGVLGDEIEDAVGDALVVEESKVGGYPHFTQYDVREGTFEQFDTLLFQLVSTDFNGKNAIMFGDCGVCNFFISKEDLRRRDFTNVLYTWDCF